MAGGTFTEGIAKERPGVYVNVKGHNNIVSVGITRGVVTMPLIGYDWGPRDTFIRISANQLSKHDDLGRSILDQHNASMRLIRLALMNADVVHAYIPDGGTAASGTATIGSAQLTMKAKYKGTFGNTLKVASVANPIGGFDVSIHSGTEQLELFEGITTVKELIDAGSNYIIFSGKGNLAAFASASLSSGTDSSDNVGVTKFLDACERLKFNAMAFPLKDNSLKIGAVSKIRFIRESIGRKCKLCLSGYNADYEGVNNVVNSFAIDGVEYTAEEATAWIAGVEAAADMTVSNTYTVVSGAEAIVGEKTHEEAVASIKKGEMFFTYNEDGQVILEYDINSLVTFTSSTPNHVQKNKMLRIYDTFVNEISQTLRPKAFNNRPDGWEGVESLGKDMLTKYEKAGVLMNVDLDTDFKVDREKSDGDAMYINVWLQAVDSAEKYYVTVNTQ